jgi:hypothetical protein
LRTRRGSESSHQKELKGEPKETADRRRWPSNGDHRVRLVSHFLLDGLANRLTDRVLGCYLLSGAGVGDGVATAVAGGAGARFHMSSRFFQVSPSTTINLQPVALGVHRTEFLALQSRTPFPVAPRLITSRSYHVRGILIALVEMVAKLNLLEHVCPMLLDGRPTVNRTCVIDQNRVLRLERTESGGIAAVECLVSLLTERTELLGYL